MKRERAHYEPAYGVAICQPAVPISMIVVGYNDRDGSFFDYVQPVVAVMAEIKGSYTRDSHGQYDLGLPRSPDNAQSLTREGYEASFGHRHAIAKLMVLDRESLRLRSCEDAAQSINVAVDIIETSMLEEWKDAIVQELQKEAKENFLRSRQK